MTSVERGGKRRLCTGSCPCDRLSRTEKYYGQPHRVAGFSRCLDAIRCQRCRPTASRPWHVNPNANGPVVGKLSSGSVSPRTYYICIMRLRMGSAAGDGQSPSLSTGGHHPHNVARAERAHRLRLDPAAWREVELAALGRQGEDERRLHQGGAFADALAWPAAEREVGVGRPGGKTFGGEPIGVEALRVLPQRKIAVRHVGACGDRRVGTDAAPTRCRPRSPAGW